MHQPQQRQPQRQPVKDKRQQTDAPEQREKGGDAYPAGQRRQPHSQRELQPVDCRVARGHAKRAVTAGGRRLFVIVAPPLLAMTAAAIGAFWWLGARG